MSAGRGIQRRVPSSRSYRGRGLAGRGGRCPDAQRLCRDARSGASVQVKAVERGPGLGQARQPVPFTVPRVRSFRSAFQFAAHLQMIFQHRRVPLGPSDMLTRNILRARGRHRVDENSIFPIHRNNRERIRTRVHILLGKCFSSPQL
jgi:hypothetical protein